MIGWVIVCLHHNLVRTLVRGSPLKSMAFPSMGPIL